ncbi:MAG: class III signal peptide-containing protein [archaeon]|nr:class III signal peptide-containing protein [archaeon]
MYLDNKGQSSAEVILLIGGIIVIVILVGSYITK